MTDNWDLIANDLPREWLVLVDGSYFTRDTSTAATILADAARWLEEELAWSMDYGTRKAHVLAVCKATAERVSGKIEVTVTPESGPVGLQ